MTTENGKAIVPFLPDRIQYGGHIYERTGHGGTTKDGVYTHIDVSYRLVPSAEAEASVCPHCHGHGDGVVAPWMGSEAACIRCNGTGKKAQPEQGCDRLVGRPCEECPDAATHRLLGLPLGRSCHSESDNGGGQTDD